MVRFREMRSYVALKEIFRHKKSWDFLLNYVQSYDEIEEDELGNIQFVYWNGESLDDNLLSDRDDYFWIAGYDEQKRLCFLQLMRRVSRHHIELVVAQKKRSSAEENLFSSLVDYVRGAYEAKWLSTFPLNDRLRDYYKAKGFYDWRGELKMDL